VLGELVQTTAGKWITHPPTRCPTDAPSAPGKYWWRIKRVSGMAAGKPPGRCRTCGQTVYGPPINTHCNSLNGPAVVRISNATYIPMVAGRVRAN
jgi:hypothetical protein